MRYLLYLICLGSIALLHSCASISIRSLETITFLQPSGDAMVNLNIQMSSGCEYASHIAQALGEKGFDYEYSGCKISGTKMIEEGKPFLLNQVKPFTSKSYYILFSRIKVNQTFSLNDLTSGKYDGKINGILWINGPDEYYLSSNNGNETDDKKYTAIYWNFELSPEEDYSIKASFIKIHYGTIILFILIIFILFSKFKNNRNSFPLNSKASEEI